jgi:DNA-binding Lrp family transcriptional regulator
MWRTVELSVNIMRELSITPSHWNVKRSYSEVAKKLGVDEETVRIRVQSLKKGGFLLGWRLILNARLLGRESSILAIELNDTKRKDRAVKQISRLDGVVLIQSFYGKTLQVTIFSESEEELERQMSKITSISGGEIFTHWRVKLPRCNHRPKQIDWMIIGALLKDADKKISTIARELKVSAKTVKRRVSMMMESSAFFLQPILDLKKVAGVLPCQLLVQCTEERKSIIDDLITSKFERIVFSLTDSSTHSIFTIICMNLAEAQSISKEIEKEQGVTLVKMEIIEDLTYVHDWLMKEVEARVFDVKSRLHRPTLH